MHQNKPKSRPKTRGRFLRRRRIKGLIKSANVGSKIYLKQGKNVGLALGY
jgi:hypothetical protein